MSKLKAETREKLKTVSTATLCTALFKRGLRNQFIQDVHPLNPNRRARWSARRSRCATSRRARTSTRSRCSRIAQHPQRKAVEECPPGAVFVIDSRKDARAASAGAILVTRLMKRGVAGIVTDGGFRDAPEIAKLAIPAYHQRPAAPTNLTLHQAIDINVPIGCGDAPVFPGDVVVGDGEGVVVIPAHLADEVAAEAVEMTAFEDFVTEEVRRAARSSACIRRPMRRRRLISRPGARRTSAERLLIIEPQSRPLPLEGDQLARSRQRHVGRAQVGTAEADVGWERIRHGDVLPALAVRAEHGDAAVDQRGDADVAVTVDGHAVEPLVGAAGAAEQATTVR